MDESINSCVTKLLDSIYIKPSVTMKNVILSLKKQIHIKAGKYMDDGTEFNRKLKPIFVCLLLRLGFGGVFLLSCVFFSAPAFSQCQINGTLIDASNSPVAFASILLLSAVDSSLIKGSISDEAGKFMFPL